MMGRRCTAALAGALLGGLGVLVGPAGPATAHAVVVAADPQPGSVLGTSPTRAVLRFSEPVRLIAGRAQVIAPDGKRIATGEPTVTGTTVTIPIRVADRPLGTYLVSYRVISADSHPVGGGYTFSVGAPSASVAEPDDGTADPAVAFAIRVDKYLGYLGLALAVGPALFLALLWPPRLSRRPARRLVRAGLSLVGIAAVAGLWLQAPYTSGAGLFDVSVTELETVMTSWYGVMVGLRLAVLAAVSVLLGPVLAGHGGRRRAALVGLLTVVGLSTWPLTGHGAAAPVPAVSVAADTVHIAAMTVWLGGLAVLGGRLLRHAHPRVLARILPAWSRWATIAVCWLVLAGGLQAVLETGSVRALTTSRYGQLVLAKIGLIVVLLGTAWYARRLVHRQAGDRPGRLTGVVRIELALAVVALGVSAVLVQTTPGRTAISETVALTTDSFAQTLSSELYTMQFDIYPVQLGEHNTVHAYVYTAQGKPLAVEEWTLTTALPEQKVEPVSTVLLGLQPHHAVGSVAFPVPGDWQVRFTLRVSEIDQATVTTTVPVR